MMTMRSMAAAAALALAAAQMTAPAAAQDDPRPDAAGGVGQTAAPGAIVQEVIRGLDAMGVSYQRSDVPTLPRSLWTGADSAMALYGLKGLDVAGLSNAERDLARTLAFSGGVSPLGEGASELPEARLALLASLGEASALKDVALRAPGGLNDPSLAIHAAEAAFALGDPGTACALPDGVAPAERTPALLRIKAACFLLDDQPAAAQLTFDLAATSGLEDPWLATLIVQRSVDAKLSKIEARDQSALDAALANHFGLKRTEETKAAAGPMALLAIYNGSGAPAGADNASAPIDDPIWTEQASLAWRLLGEGALPPEEAAAAFDNITADAQVSAGLALESALDSKGIARTAWLWKAASQISDALISAEAAHQAWGDAANARDRRATAALFGEVVDVLPPLPELSPYANSLGEAAIARGDLQAAVEWFRLADRASETKEGLARARRAALVAALGGPVRSGLAEMLVEAAGDDAEKQARAAAAMMVLQAVEVDLGPKARMFALEHGGDTSGTPPAGLLAAADAATERGAQGELVAITLGAMAMDESGGMSWPSTVLLANLSETGLTEQARAIAAERLSVLLADPEAS